MKIGKSIIIKYSNTGRWYNPYILQADWLVKLQILNGLKDLCGWEHEISHAIYTNFTSMY